MHRLTRIAALASLTLLIPACDATDPRIGSARLYQLTAVDGSALPAVINAANGDTVSVVWATLTLDDTHHAIITTQYHHNYMSYPDTDVTTASRSAWRQRDDSIEIGFFGHCRDICPQNLTGTVSGLDLTVRYESYPPLGPVYDYHLMAMY